ncbi:SpaH/EbpB family LPXTG-anchored major pilin [Streptococcus suis]|uniref:SpaH/EbpB family LPXTG-anchored major pilin n=1 Tax=Streptococcus parasuis TaxID=1501662 RepID=UPI00155776F1|nr:SpaH/EbpB family LPXTG-anchored major pilin [Streptococcus suis]WNF87302.1 SpaH/EbpB family LPXTG-anchored major pilin [Streptococcus parasuis]
MKLIRKLVTGLMILLVALGSSPLEVFALPNNGFTEWPTGGTNDVTSTLPQPPAAVDIVDLNQMFNYPELDYSGLTSERPWELNVIKSLKGYVPVNDSSVAVITRDAPWQAGVMWSKEESNKINLAEPFHMVSYVYLGSRGQAEKIVDGNKRAGADGITFTIHNDNKTPVANTSGSDHNTGKDAYGALGNGLGVYGSNFSANTASSNNNMAYMTKGVTNGIALEFDTFYNHNNTTQHSDNDLWQFVGSEGSSPSNWGHIGINYLNELQNNVANNDGKQFGYGSDQVIKHNTMLAVGWDGGISGLDPQYGWQVSTPPQTKLADNKWHRLEVKWEPTTLTTGKLTYKIYQQGHTGERNISDIYDTSKDGTAVLEKTVTVNVGNVFGVSDINNKVYWGFTGSTGYYQNNQAVQMLQLPKPYYKSGIRKVDQDGNLVKNAKFQLEVRNGGIWQPVVFQKVDGSGTQDYVLTGVDNGLIGVITDLDETSSKYGTVTATQLLAGTYRWVEIEAPEGYKIDSPITPVNGFELKYLLGSDNNGLSIDFDVRNIKLSQIELYKKDKDTDNPLNGVKFTISKVLDGVTSYLKAKSDNSDFEWTTTEKDAKEFETGKSYFVRNGEIVEEATEDGYIRIGYIENGVDLKWKEVSVPAGYDSSGTMDGSFSTPEDNKYLYQATQTNSRLYQVSLEKTASDTNDALPGAVFSLEQQVGSEWEAVGANKTTGVDGKITISNLTSGTYRWKEVTAPDGYQISQPYYPDQNGFVVAYDSTLAIDPDTNNYIFNTTSVTNAPRDFELTLEKLSSTFQKPLQGVEFKLYDSAGGTDFSTLTPKATVTTDADGKIVLNNEQIQADKTYYLVESQTVDGFIQLKGYFTITTSKVDGIDVTYVKAGTETDSSPFEFTKKDGDIYSGHLTIYNKRKSILPETGGNGILGYVGIGLTMTIVALLFFLARKRVARWLVILLVATSGLAGLAGGTQVVSAQEQEQVQLEVNRLVYQPSDTQYKSGVPVAGAKLEVVDVTKSFYELVNRQKLSLKEAQEAVSKSNKIDGQSLAVATTDQSGLVRFTVSKTSQQRPAVYLVRELVTPVAVTKMENMVVVLPILDESGNEKSLISLFPKSHGTFSFDKTIDEKQSSYSFGEPISYRLSTIIPQDMTNLSSYEIEDIYDQGLRFISDSLEIFIDGEKQSDSIKAVNLSENQFRVVFDVAKLADFGGKKLEVTYQMVIKDEAAIDQDLVNTATLYPGDLTPLVDRENVRTGGFRFIKRAAEGKQNPLAKATFVIKNPTDDTVLTYKEGKYQFEKVATNASGVVRLTSDEDGYFEIKGLRYGEYLVSEVRAPSGYVLNDKPTAFTVGVSTYSQGPVLSIFNVKKPKIRLPETGTVVTSTAFVGLLIMASSLMMIRRKKEN